MLAILAFMIGAQIIKLVRRIVKKSMTKAKADVGVIQFTDSFVKVALYMLLVFLIAGSFGVDTTTKTNFSSAVYTARSAVSVARTLAAVIR